MSKTFTYDYDSSYSPAIPIAEIEIGRVGAETPLTLAALVDSGADATMIPWRFLRQIRARRSRKTWMRGTTGNRMLVDLYIISLKLGAFTLAHLEAVSNNDDDEVIIGRDILNHLIVTLNGPANTVEIANNGEA
jgi:hypothetical protein